MIDLPLNGYGHQCKDASADGYDGHELWDFTINPAERPVVGNHADEIEDDVECADHSIGDG